MYVCVSLIVCSKVYSRGCSSSLFEHEIINVKRSKETKKEEAVRSSHSHNYYYFEELLYITRILKISALTLTTYRLSTNNVARVKQQQRKRKRKRKQIYTN